MTLSDYDRTIESLLRSRRGKEATDLLFRDSGGTFTTYFNEVTQTVDAIDIGKVVAYTRRALERMVRTGRVRNANDFAKAMRKVLTVTVRHFGVLAWNRDHPLVPSSSPPAGHPDRRRSVVNLEPNVAAPPGSPADGLLRAELIASILHEARTVGALHVRVAHAYRRYEFEFGKTYGAYVHIARLAVLDTDGQVVKVRTWRTQPDAARPAARVIRQVRAIHLEACDRIRAAAERLGYTVPSA